MTKISPKLRVLVVDDEPLIRWSLAETLNGAGHEVVEAGSGQAALAAASQAGEPFDVLLLDFRLPDSNDLGLLTRLRALMPSASVIMMTAYGTSDFVEAAVKLGVYRILSKPFEIDELAALVVQAYQARP